MLDLDLAYPKQDTEASSDSQTEAQEEGTEKEAGKKGYFQKVKPPVLQPTYFPCFSSDKSSSVLPLKCLGSILHHIK